MTTWKVEVTGLRQVMDALASIDKSAAKAITKEITNAGKAVVGAAKGITPGSNPISGWGSWLSNGRDLGYNPSTAAASFKLRKNNFRRRGVSAGMAWDVYQTNPGGAIYELLGSGSSQFVDSIAGRYPGKQPRTLIPAYRAGVPEGLKDKIADQILTEARRAGLV